MVDVRAGILIGFGLFLTLIVAGTYWGRKVGVEEFLAADRDVGFRNGTASLLATWTAPPAILVSSQVAYQMGLAGVFWFTVPNALALIIFALAASRIKNRLPQGYTISELFGYQSKKLYGLVTFFTFLKSFITLASAVVGGAAFLTFFSSLSKISAIAIILAILLTYSYISGLGASILTDVVQMLVIGILIAVIVPWTVSTSNGLELVAQEFSISGLSEIFAPSSLTFGLSISVVLLTAPFISQFIWQRVYAIRAEDLQKSFVATGILFFFIPLGLALLGLIAAAQGSGISVENPLLAGYVVMNSSLPLSAASVAFLILVAALLSTGDSALVACSSILTVDVMDNLLEQDLGTKHTFRISMILLTVVIGISAASPISFLDWVLFNAPIGIVLTVPILFVLYSSRPLSSEVIFYSTAAATVISFPLYVYGSIGAGGNLYRLYGLLIGFVVVTTPILLHSNGYIYTAPDNRIGRGVDDTDD